MENLVDKNNRYLSEAIKSKFKKGKQIKLFYKNLILIQF